MAFILIQSCYLNDNYIIGIFKINQKNSAERILNGVYANKTSVDIYLNNEKIDFNKTIVFPKEGEYIIKYNFKERISRMDRLFYQCNSITRFISF